MITLSERLIRLGYSDYQSYLRSEHWSQKKRQYLSSNSPKYCLICGNSQYDLHHLTYERLGNELISDLFPLCRRCHRILHDYTKKKRCGLNNMQHILEEAFGLDREAAASKMITVGKEVSKEKKIRLVHPFCGNCGKKYSVFVEIFEIELAWFKQRKEKWLCKKCRPCKISTGRRAKIKYKKTKKTLARLEASVWQEE